MDRIFSIIDPSDVVSGKFSLSPAESHHLIRVLRKQPGEELWLLNGSGTAYLGIIRETSSIVTGDIRETHENYGENSSDIHLVLAVLKRNALETAVEQAVEFGVRSITLVITGHTIKKDVNLDRLQKIIRAAAKQCGRSRFPVVIGPLDFTAWLDPLESGAGITFACHWIGTEPVGRFIADSGSGSVRCIIGPEGDFTAAEISLLKQKGIPFATLGNRRLRAETAVSAVLAAVNDGLLTKEANHE